MDRRSDYHSGDVRRGRGDVCCIDWGGDNFRLVRDPSGIHRADAGDRDRALIPFFISRNLIGTWMKWFLKICVGRNEYS